MNKMKTCAVKVRGRKHLFLPWSVPEGFGDKLTLKGQEKSSQLVKEERKALQKQGNSTCKCRDLK